MAGEGYELLALFMRYVFVALGALIVWHAFRWMRKDAKAYKRQMRRLPDAGLVGEIVNLNTGERLPLPREGIMGASSSCDVRVKGNGVARRHVLFSLAEGKGLCMTPCGRKRFMMEDIEMSGPAYALHGTVVCLGDVPLRVRLFAGINVPHPMAFEPEEDEWEEPWDFPGESTEVLPAFRDPEAFDPNLDGEDAPEVFSDEEDEALPYQSPLPELCGRGRRE